MIVRRCCIILQACVGGSGSFRSSRLLPRPPHAAVTLRTLRKCRSCRRRCRHDRSLPDHRPTPAHSRSQQDSRRQPASGGAHVTRAARLVRKRAVHFAGVNPPPDFSEAHAGLSAALSRVADALEAMGSAFQRCAEAPCQAQLDSLSGRRYMSITYTDTTFESFGRTDRAITGVLVQRSSDSVRFRIHTTPDALVSMVDITVHPASERGERPVTRRIGMPKGDAAGRRDIGRLSRAARAARARRRRR